ncbi:MAG: membrane integrity-associated transporter subunit PqiC [Methylophaga sp.]|nr:membrane integrity-associated transporter subunit PqiC [Methylophaga sp.]
MKYIGFIILLTLLTGCLGLGSKEEDNSPHYYVIDVGRGAVASRFVENRVLYIKPVKLTSHFRGQTIVFRIADEEYQAQAPHQFFSDPQEMFTEQLQRWLQKTGLFSQVVVNEDVAADMILETAVTALYGDKREQFSPQSVLEMQFFLLGIEQNKKRVLFQTGLKVEVDIPQTTPPNVVKGWKQGLEQLLSTMEDDLSDYFSKRKP